MLRIPHSPVDTLRQRLVEIRILLRIALRIAHSPVDTLRQRLVELRTVLSNLNSQRLFTPAELLGGGFCSQLFASSEVNQLGFLISFEPVLCYLELSSTQFTILNAFSPRQGLLCGIFVHSCSPLARIVSWLFAFP